MSTQFAGTVASGGPPAVGSYPIDVQIDYPTSPGRIYAIPVLGFVIRAVLLIPHVIALWLLGLVLGITQLFVWIPVLFTGRYPEGLYSFSSGVVRWAHVIQVYQLGLTDRYPPFSLGNTAGYPVQIHFERPDHSTPGWAIPIVGFIAKCIILIPHFVILYVLVAISGLLMLAAWVPVLFAGHFPEWAYSLQSGTIRWSTHVNGYLLGLTDTYPPFSLT